MIVAVIAKAPVAGRVKTRLCPPCTPRQAAELAEASLRDTLRAVALVRATRHVLVLDGVPGPWLPSGFEVVAQRGDGLDERLAAAFEDLGGPALVIGMDTPHLSATDVQEALDALRFADAVLGPAADGGYWCIGLREPRPEALIGVPMSVAGTFAAQRARLAALGLSFAVVSELRDMDTIEDARAIAAAAPHLMIARALDAVTG